MKRKGMNPTRAGVFYLVVICGFVLLSLLAVLYELRVGFGEISLAQNILLSEGVVVVPAVLFALGSDAGEVFRLKRVRLSTLFLTVLYVLCLEPLISALNAFTMIFTDNRALELAQEVAVGTYSFPVMTLFLAVFGPFCEELAFRGVAYAGLRRSGRILAAILLQALMFGCMHLNLNQMPYATAIGIAFGLLAEVTGSIWPGFLGHALINFTSVTAAFFSGSDLLTEDLSYTGQEIASSFAVYAVLSVFFTAMAVCVLIRIAGNETGGEERLKRIFSRKDPLIVNPDGSVTTARRPRALTLPAALGLIAAAVIMIATG